MKRETLLITGSNGFLGTALVRRLLEHGGYDVRCLVRPGSDSRRLSSVIAAFPTVRDGSVSIVSGSLASPAEAGKLLDGVDTVVHLAAALKGPAAEMFLGTVVSTKNLMEAIAHASAPPRLLSISSFGVYGVAEEPRGAVVDESTPLERHPERRDHYSHSKLRQEELVADYRARFGLRVCTLRPGVIYGPGGGAFSGRVGIDMPGVFLFLGGKNLLPLSYVDNCAEAIRVALEKATFDGDVYNVHDDDLITCADYLRRYQEEVRHMRVLRLPFPATMMLSRAVEWYHRKSRGQLPAIFTPYKTRTSWQGNRFSNAKLKGLGFQPIVSTEDGLARTFEYLREKVRA
ncbi:MAG: NAD(P)-dependent oxidoreductase [Polyangiaceae bacterium]